jgi:hypothetical protein
MTTPEQFVVPAAAGATMSSTYWNDAVASTRFPAYIYNATTYQYGGNLNAYRRTWSGYDLGSIESYGSRYTEFRDIRSTYIAKTVDTGSSPASNVWTTATAYTYISNTYNSTNQEGRLTLNTTTGEITPNANSAYIFWAEMKISSVPVNVTAAFMQIRAGGSTIADINQNVDLITGQSMRLRGQTFVAYKNIPYTIRYKLIYSGYDPTHVISFGYTELIGQKSGCGAYSIL